MLHKVSFTNITKASKTNNDKVAYIKSYIIDSLMWGLAVKV